MQFGFGNFDGILVPIRLEAIVLQDLSPFVSRENNSSIHRFWNVKLLSLIVHAIRYLILQCNLGSVTLMLYLFMFDLRLFYYKICRHLFRVRTTLVSKGFGMSNRVTYSPRHKLSDDAMHFGFSNFDGILVPVRLEAIVLQDLSPFVSRENNSSIQRFWNVKLLSLIVHAIRYLIM